MKRVFFISCLLFLSTTCAWAQQTSPFEDNITWDRLKINIYKFENISQKKLDLIFSLMEESQTISNLQKSFRHMYAAADKDKKAILLKSVSLPELVEQLIPVYDKYYTESDLQQITDFLKSDAGKKMVEAAPHITEDAVQVTANYFKSKLQP